MKEQDTFWRDRYGAEYMAANAEFDAELGKKAWSTMLARTAKPATILELGSNIGRNTRVLRDLLPEAELSICEINPTAFQTVTSSFPIAQAENCAIREATFQEGAFELVFTMGVLIHIDPEELIDHLHLMENWSSRYILMGEYFNRTPVTLPYHGEAERLFKCDFGKIAAENLDAQVLDYGFLWGYEFDTAGFDDITWWLFEKSRRE